MAQSKKEIEIVIKHVQELQVYMQ
jgi:hypothetical protein